MKSVFLKEKKFGEIVKSNKIGLPTKINGGYIEFRVAAETDDEALSEVLDALASTPEANAEMMMVAAMATVV